MNTTPLKIGVMVVAALAILTVIVMSFNVAASGLVVVTGNTSAGENQTGWYFNRDKTTYTSYAFTQDAHTFGLGSLYAGPILNTNSGNFDSEIPDNPPNNDMFVAEYFPGDLPVADFQKFSYDFMIGPSGENSQAHLFYLEIYANVDNSDNDFDCKYTYVAESGSKSTFTKSVAFANGSPTSVLKHSDQIESCPGVLSAMPEGSHIRAFKLTMGDQSADDTNLDGYFDNIELVMAAGVTNFDFEAGPQTKDDCQGKNWKMYGFKSQGQCIKYVDKGTDTR